MEKEQAKFILRCSRPPMIESEYSDFAAAHAFATGDRELRDWLVDEHACDNAIAAALRAVPVPASLRRELSIGMEWTARSGKPLNRFCSACATLRRHFDPGRGGHASPRGKSPVRQPNQQQP